MNGFDFGLTSLFAALINMDGFDFGFKMTFNICLKFKKDAFNNRFLLQSKHPNQFIKIIQKKNIVTKTVIGNNKIRSSHIIIN